MSTITAKLSVRDADRAIAFYEQALGARCIERYTAGGSVVVSRLAIGDSHLEVKDGDQVDPPIEELGASPVLFTLEVSDARAVFDRLVRHGAQVRFELDQQVYGMLQGRVVDPFGVHWIVSELVEDLSAQQIQERIDREFG